MMRTNEELKELAITHLISKSGFNENGLIYSINMCVLPELIPTEYDIVFNICIEELSHLNSDSYSLILFCAETKFMPSWTWILGTYYKLDHMMRKNLKGLYVVHPSSWARVFFKTISFVISPKFAKKLFWLDTITELAPHVPFKDLYIPDAICKFNSKVDTSEFSKRLFGKPLIELESEFLENDVPMVISRCIDHIKANGLETEGIFRIPGSKYKIDSAIIKWNLGLPVDMEELGIHSICSLLKQYFRELPDSIFQTECETEIKCLNNDDILKYTKEKLLPSLPKLVYNLYKILFGLLFQVWQMEKINRMSSLNLTIIWTPNFLKGDTQMEYLLLGTTKETGGYSKIVQSCIENYAIIFT